MHDAFVINELTDDLKKFATFLLDILYPSCFLVGYAYYFEHLLKHTKLHVLIISHYGKIYIFKINITNKMCN